MPLTDLFGKSNPAGPVATSMLTAAGCICWSSPLENVDKRERKLIQVAAAANTFEVIARQWLKKTAAERADSTQGKLTTWLEKDAFPYIGKMPISTISPRDVSLTVQKMEAQFAAGRQHVLAGQANRHDKQFSGPVNTKPLSKGSGGARNRISPSVPFPLHHLSTSGDEYAKPGCKHDTP